jgi:hypothetical protein
VRLLLDANLSPRRIGEPLTTAGHDVRALAAHPELEGLADPDVLVMAASEGRILITRNSRHFAPILREWAEAGRVHAGCILIWTLGHAEFAPIIAGVERLVGDRPEQDDWRDIAAAL